MKYRYRNKKIFCFDLDGVICKTRGNKYSKAKPNFKAIKLINKLYFQGSIVKIFTSRHMTKFKGNVAKVKKFGYLKTKKQLKRWQIKYNQLIMGKPSYDFFVDDKAIGFKKNWIKLLKKVIK